MAPPPASTFATTLENRGVSVGTVEHLLAALSGLAIDNVIVEMDAPEAPIMDRSAAPFVSLIRETGAVEQNQPRKYMVVRKAVRVVDNGRWMELSPSRDLKISCTVDFAHPLISKQFYEVSLPGKRFEEEIGPARTFGRKAFAFQMNLFDTRSWTSLGIFHSWDIRSSVM